eukprot:8049726-Pyramimonas_sp.AAC.1
MAEPCLLAICSLTPNRCVQCLAPGGSTMNTQPARSPYARQLVQGGAAPGAVQVHTRGKRVPPRSSNSREP